jgi:hypothetical protein
MLGSFRILNFQLKTLHNLDFERYNAMILLIYPSEIVDLYNSKLIHQIYIVSLTFHKARELAS